MPEGLANLFTTSVATPGTDNAQGTLPVADPVPSALAGLSFPVIVNPGQPTAEIMEVTGGQTTTTWTVTRASEPLGKTGTQVAYAHSAGESINAVISVAGLRAWMRTQLIARGQLTGNGTTTAFTVAHNLGLPAPYTPTGLNFYDDATGAELIPETSALQANQLTATFTPALASGRVIDWAVEG